MEDKNLLDAYDALAKDWNLEYSQNAVLSSRYYLKQYEELHNHTLALPGSSLLDWGAGYGHFAYVQSYLGKKVKAYSPVGDDYTIYTKTLEALAKKGSFEYEFSKEPILLPYQENSFDIAVSCGVLEHVREFGGDDVKSLSELFRIIKKGGHLVIGHLPNTGSWIEAICRKTGRQHHTFLYTNKEIKKKVTEAGFVIKKHERYGVLPKNSMAIFLTRYNQKNIFIKFFTEMVYASDKYLFDKLFPWAAQNHLLILQKPE